MIGGGPFYFYSNRINQKISEIKKSAESAIYLRVKLAEPIWKPLQYSSTICLPSL